MSASLLLFIVVCALIFFKYRFFFIGNFSGRSVVRHYHYNRRFNYKRVSHVESSLDSFEKGDIFEDYLESNLFISRYFDLVYRTPNKKTNDHRFIESSLMPDFLFRHKVSGLNFYVEAKFRSNFYVNLKWCKDFQFDRYVSYDSVDRPVFIALGVGGFPSRPNEVYFIPLSSISSHVIDLRDYERYRLRLFNGADFVSSLF